MNLSDAKTILGDVLDYEILDSLYMEYKNKDSLNTGIIEIQKTLIDKLKTTNSNNEQIIENNETIVGNKNKELGIKDDTIKKQKKEIKKQKFLKSLGFIGSIVLPILTLLALN
jgi:hypothetical protein